MESRSWRTFTRFEGDVKGIVAVLLFRVIAKKSVPSVMNEK